MESISKLTVRRRLILEAIHVTQPWPLHSMAKRILLVDVVLLDVKINPILVLYFFTKKLPLLFGLCNLDF